jgi:carboxyl-terminal processing protease
MLAVVSPFEERCLHTWEAVSMNLLKPRKLIVLSLFIFVSGLALASAARDKGQDKQTVIQDLETFAKVVEKIQSFYVDEVDTHGLIEAAIEDMLGELDPHSEYMSGLVYEDLRVKTQGEFGGLGIFISFRDNYPTVISPIDGTPAQRAGIEGGDQIIEIEGESSEGWAVEKTVRYLRGTPGTAVRFKINRPGLNDPIEYNLVREKIEVESVPYSGKFGDVGYVKLSDFSKSTEDELHGVLKELESQGISALVLDLRTNPGGLLQAATGVSELFLDKDKLIVYTKGRYAQNNQKYYSGQSRKHNGYPVVVMINGASASASEIVAGALQDWDAALVVGQTSFGKATVQTVFELSDTQAVKLTTARYYTPSGRSIHRDEQADKTGEEIANAHGALEDGEPMTGSTAAVVAEVARPVYKTSGGRTVYGGGGITPDVEFEPQTYGELERRLERDGLFFSFAVDYSMNHKVKEGFQVTDEVLRSFKDMLATREFEYKEEDFSGNSLEYVKRAILREVTAKNFGRKAMYRAVLERDPELQKVLEICRKSPTLDEMFAHAERQRELKKASLD